MRALALVLCLVAPKALAVGVEIDVAGGYWFAGTPQFQGRLGINQQLTKFGTSSRLVLGLNAGVFWNTAGTRIGIPVDLTLALHVSRVFFAVVGGPWFHFNDNDVLRAHLGGEFGVTFGRIFSVSIEAGWLQPAPLLLGRLGVRF
ncbi:MAG: hypothetical protein SFW67_03250 [Myxococcaceae bacterium]|nr:hypothetical protein [Myxococcaceae bacterium]